MSERLQNSPVEGPVRPERLRWLWLESAGVLAIGMVVMQFIYAGPGATSDGARGVPGNDSFYHIKMAALISEHGILREFPWLRFSYFTEEGNTFVSHHYGFHLLLAPVVALSKSLTGDYQAGARWAMSTFFGVSLMLFNLILLTGRIRWRWLWLLLFFLMPHQFFVRHAFVRAIGPSLMFMLLIVLLMFQRRRVWTGVAIAVYCQVYLGAVLYAPLLVGLYLCSAVLGAREDRTKLGRMLLAAALGWIVGVAVHPYSHGIWEFLKLQVLGSGLSPDIPVGREWKSYDGVWWFASMSAIVIVVWTIALCARLRVGKPLNVQELMLVLAHFVFLGLTIKARRFIEYWPVFCLLSAAYLSAPLIGRLAIWCDRLVGSDEDNRASWLTRGGALLVAVGMLATVYTSPLWSGIRKTAGCSFDLPAVEQAMAFLKTHSDPGDVVFTDDWDIFPVYFYYNSHNHYVVGLDPKFTHARRPALWQRYVKLSRGQVPADISVSASRGSDGDVKQTLHVILEDIRTEFGASFVVTDRDHKDLAAKLAAAPDLADLLYPSDAYDDVRDAPYLIFRIHEPAE